MSATFRRTAATMSTEVRDDVVALQTELGFTYGMEAVSASVGKLPEEPRDLDALIEELTAEIDIDKGQCREEVGSLLDRMTLKGLVEQVQ